MRHTTEHSNLIFDRIFDAAVRIIALYSGIPTDESRFICGKLYRLLSVEYGISAGSAAELPDEKQLLIFHRGAVLLSGELQQRNVSLADIDELIGDLESFYRSVRSLPPKLGS